MISRLTACSLALLLSATHSSVRAQEQIVGSITLAATDRVDAALVRGGFTGFRPLMNNLIDGLRMVRRDDVDAASPLSLHLVCGDQVTRQQAVMFAIPLRPAAMPLQPLVDRGGAQWLEGHPDTITARGFPFRRTAGYLLFGGTPSTIVKPTEATLAAPTHDQTTLLRAEIDLQAAKRAAPRNFENTLRGVMEDGARARGQVGDDESPARAAGRKAGRDAMIAFVRGLHHCGFSIGTRAAAGTAPELASVEMSARPIALKRLPHSHTRPALPPGTFARIDYAYPAAEAVPALLDQFIRLVEIGKGFDGPDAITKEGLRQVFTPIARLLVGDAVTLGVAPADPEARGLVTQVIVQRLKPLPLDAQLDEIERTFRATANAPEGELPWKRSRYKDGALTVTRLAMVDRGVTFGYFDLVDQGDRLVGTYGVDAGRHVARLASLDRRPGQPIDALAMLDVDLKALDAATRGARSNVVPPELRPMLPLLPKTGRLSVTADGDGTAFTIRAWMPLSGIGSILSSTLPAAK